MGQKTHPTGFRLITTQNHLSSWYNNKLAYKNSLEEDSKLRLKIEQTINPFLIVSQIEISKGIAHKSKKDKTEATIYALFPTEQEMFKCFSNYFESMLVLDHSLLNEVSAKKNTTSELLAKQIAYFDAGLNGKEKFDLQTGVRKLFFLILRELAREFKKETGKILKIQIRLIENPFDDAHLVAKFIGEQLEQRVPVNRTLNQVLQIIKEITNKGVKIQISGRLNGNDIARREWDLERKVPLHTLAAKIDYAHHAVRTSSGILGIKIWLFTPTDLL